MVHGVAKSQTGLNVRACARTHTHTHTHTHTLVSPQVEKRRKSGGFLEMKFAEYHKAFERT